MRMVGKGLALVLIVLGLGSCSEGTGVERTLVPAIIESGFEDPLAQNVATVLGRSLSIEAFSFGDSCREQGEVRAEVFELTRIVEVYPRDWLTTGRGICRSVLKVFRHQIRVDVHSPGPWEVRIIGVKGAVSGSGPREPHTILLSAEVS